MILHSVDRGLYIQTRHRKVPRLVFGVAVHVTGLRFVVIRGLYSLLLYVSCVQRLGTSVPAAIAYGLKYYLKFVSFLV
jgi:hypothetical protein